MIVGIIVGVIVLTLLVVAHELGHALVAKKHGTVVEEFGVGFPPKLWSKKIPNSILGKNVEYSINWLPLGGFVRLQGEHDDDTNKGDYGAMTFWQKTQVLLAGVAVNWLLAVVLLTVLALFGMPKILSNQFYVASDTQFISQPVELVSVTSGLPADKAGLRPGDKILRFAGQTLDNAKRLSELATANKGRTVSVIYSRHGTEHEAKVTLRKDNSDQKGFLGAGAPTQRELIRSTWSAPIVGFCTTAQMTWVTFEGLGQLVGNGVSGLLMKLSPDRALQEQANKSLSAVGDSVAGPLAIFGIIFPAAEKAGFTYVLMIAAVISLTLAVMNVLPIPALDGGRWFVTALYRVLRRPLTKEVEERIHGIGFMVLIFLVALVTIADIGKLR